MWEMQALTSSSQALSDMLENGTDENGIGLGATSATSAVDNESTISTVPPTDCSSVVAISKRGGGTGGLLSSDNNILNTDTMNGLQMVHRNFELNNGNTSATQIQLQRLAAGQILTGNGTVLQCAANRNGGGITSSSSSATITPTITTGMHQNETCGGAAFFVDGMVHPALRGIKAVNIGQ